jgi:ribosomal protein S18 acetylase RimI-like enzyme
MSVSDLALTRHHDAVGDVAEAISDVYVASWEHAPTAFRSRSAFVDRLNRYRRNEGFQLVTAHREGELVGFVFGYALPETSQWWAKVVPLPSREFSREDGRRTLALCEIHVRSQHRRLGIARALHDEYMRDRGAERATLCVAPDNTAAYSAYMAWGWHVVGKSQPFPDSPVFDVLVLPLGDR